MPSPSSTRLERALELFVKHQHEGGDWHELLALHPEFADLLESFVADTDAETPPAHETWIGEFRLVAEIGRGGVGTVYEARQRSLDRRVALKVLHTSFTANPTALARFKREAMTLARLDHPGIVRVFAVGEDNVHHWLAMELLDGQSLAARLDTLRADGGHSGDSMRRLVEAIARVATALQHAHEAGIVHRDVKPSNILLQTSGGAVLGDFGLARDAESPSLTQTGIVSGTPHYMAPEQVLGRTADCDARTDVWGLGATLYECLTLQHAFDGTNTQQVLQAVMTREPTDPRRHQRGLPSDLAAIVHKALEKAPNSRYQTARAFAEDLRAFLELRPVAARAPTRAQRLIRFARRKPMIAVLLMLGFVTTMLGAGLLWQLPAVRAVARARVESDYEDAMVAGLLARTGPDAEACYSQFRRAMELLPDHTEATVGLCFGLGHFAGPAAAIAELDRHSGALTDPQMLRCRSVMLRLMGRTDEAAAIEKQLGPPTTSMDLLLCAAALCNDENDIEALRQANKLVSLAVRIAPHPRLLLHAQWASLQRPLNDEAGRLESTEALLRLWPDHPLALEVAATNLLQADPKRALSLLRRALDLGLADPLGPVNLGIAQAMCGQPDAAIPTLEKAMQQPGLSEAARWRIVEIVSQLGDLEAVSRISTTWLQRDPRSLGARRAAARDASRHGDHERAIALLRECAAEAPKSFGMREDLAFALLNNNDATAAREQLTLLLAEQPTLDRTHLMMLDALDELHDEAAALEEAQRWANACPKDSEAWSELALTLLATSRPDAAERALAAAERADYLALGKRPKYLELRAKALDLLHRGDEATQLRRRAAALPK
jgi:tetratricopeptide (TPR) repeat protein